MQEEINTIKNELEKQNVKIKNISYRTNELFKRLDIHMEWEQSHQIETQKSLAKIEKTLDNHTKAINELQQMEHDRMLLDSQKNALDEQRKKEEKHKEDVKEKVIIGVLIVLIASTIIYISNSLTNVQHLSKEIEKVKIDNENYNELRKLMSELIKKELSK